MKTYDIELRRDWVVEFPDRCVRCNGDSEGRALTYRTEHTGWWTWILWISWKVVSVQVPACRKCTWRLRFDGWGRWIVYLVGVALIVWFGWPLLEPQLPNGFRKLGIIGLFIVCVIPIIIVHLTLPPIFEIYADGATITYCFLNQDYAMSFLVRNLDGRPGMESIETDEEEHPDDE